MGFASCKAFGRSISASLPKPQPPFPRERLCMLSWLCIVQSIWAYTPGIRAGAILLGLPHLDQARMLAVSHTKPLHDAVAQMADDLYGGFAPKQGRFGCLPKVISKDAYVSCLCRCTMQRHKQLTLQRRKTNRASNAKHPFSKII